MIFLTGSTGFLGRHLLRRLMELRPEEEFCVLVRGQDDQQARQRLLDSLSDAYQDNVPSTAEERVRVVRGELQAERFGLSSADFKEIAQSVSDVFHCAATTNLDLPIDVAWNINVDGTRHVADFALQARESGAQGWLHHVSTAYVAGDTDRIVHPEEDHDTDRKFRNSYERTKAEAEAVVRNLRPLVPTTIYRPSVIVGDSITGRTSAFNVLYLPAKLLMKGLCKALPAFPHTPFDVVPIDYVADAIAHLSGRPQAANKCYHVSAGLGRESSPLELVETLILAVDRYKHRRPKHLSSNLLVAPELLTRAFFSFSAAASHMRQLEKLVTENINVFKQLHPLIPYMLRNPRFDTSNTLADLDGIVAPPPLFSTYADSVFRYCFETNWGRRSAAPLKVA